jgi:anti-sigma B factor antagonist
LYWKRKRKNKFRRKVKMKITNKNINDVTVVSVEGSIDALTAPEISQYLNELISDGKTNLVADFSGVDYTSSAGLRVLLEAVKATRGKGGDFYLAGTRPDVEKVLNLSGFTSIIKIFSDAKLAVKSFS